MKLFDPYLGVTKEVADKDIYSQVFYRHCRLLPTATNEEKKRLACLETRYSIFFSQM